MQTPILGIAAFSGTGKTTLLRQLIPCLAADGLVLGLIKHTHHRFRLDPPARRRPRLDLPAPQVLVASPRRSALLRHHPPGDEQTLWDHLRRLDGAGLDLILVEGYKRMALPKLELHRPLLGQPLLCREDSRVLAVASDVDLRDLPVPLLDLNDIQAIVGFIHGQLPHLGELARRV